MVNILQKTAYATETLEKIIKNIPDPNGGLFSVPFHLDRSAVNMAKCIKKRWKQKDCFPTTNWEYDRCKGKICRF